LTYWWRNSGRMMQSGSSRFMRPAAGTGRRTGKKSLRKTRIKSSKASWTEGRKSRLNNSFINIFYHFFTICYQYFFMSHIRLGNSRFLENSRAAASLQSPRKYLPHRFNYRQVCLTGLYDTDPVFSRSALPGWTGSPWLRVVAMLLGRKVRTPPSRTRSGPSRPFPPACPGPFFARELAPVSAVSGSGVNPTKRSLKWEDPDH